MVSVSVVRYADRPTNRLTAQSAAAMMPNLKDVFLRILFLFNEANASGYIEKHNIFSTQDELTSPVRNRWEIGVGGGRARYEHSET